MIFVITLPFAIIIAIFMITPLGTVIRRVFNRQNSLIDFRIFGFMNGKGLPFGRANTIYALNRYVYHIQNGTIYVEERGGFNWDEIKWAQDKIDSLTSSA